MVERVKINSSEIVLKDSYGATKFNTAFAYLKTGSGTLFAGGYARAPAIYGQDSITDHASDGKYVSGLFGGIFPAYYSEYTLEAAVPGTVDGYEFRDQGAAGVYLNERYIAENSQYVQFFNYDTGVQANLSITFYWQIGLYGHGDDGQGGYSELRYEISPVLNVNFLPGSTSKNGGLFKFVYLGGHLNYTRIVGGYDQDTGQYYETTIYGSQIYSGQTIYLRSFGVYSTRQPTALSLAVTP